MAERPWLNPQQGVEGEKLQRTRCRDPKGSSKHSFVVHFGSLFFDVRDGGRGGDGEGFGSGALAPRTTR